VTTSKKKAAPPSWRHYNFTTAGPVDDYLYSMLPERSPVLIEMEQYASEHKVPIVGPAVAGVLQQLALMINARSVFELGSAIGYSTIWWAQAVGDSGRVIYTDSDTKNAERARGYFSRASAPADISPVPVFQNRSHSKSATPSKSSQSKKSNSTSFSMISTKTTIRACCISLRPVCAKAAYSSPTTCYGAVG
jgi:hypothetical protein